MQEVLPTGNPEPDFLPYGSDLAIERLEGFDVFTGTGGDFEYIRLTRRENTEKELLAREIKTNHMLDHYLKLYTRAATGIEVDEHVFALRSNNRPLRDAVDTVGTTGTGVQKRQIFDDFVENILQTNANINVNVDTSRNFSRLKNAAAQSNFFSGVTRFKNAFSPKLFTRTYSLLVNEADFVVYPYPNQVSIQNSGFDSVPLDQSIVTTLADLYDPLPKFGLTSEKQITDINSNTKDLLLNLLQENYNPLTQSDFENLFGRDRKNLFHMIQVESDTTPDLYEFFTVVSLVRSRD